MTLTRSLSALTLVVLGLTTACNNNPVENKSIAAVGQAVTEKPASVGVGTAYRFSEAGSKLAFVGAKITGKHDGSFGKFEGTITLVDNDVTRSSVHAEVQTSSLSADQEKLTGHLKSPDFFDVERFPKATFQSTNIVAASEAGVTHRVTGNLELHGVTKSLSFPATIQVTADGVTVTSEFGINRKDFGLVYPGKPDDLIKDEVLIRLNFVAKKA